MQLKSTFWQCVGHLTTFQEGAQLIYKYRDKYVQELRQ